MNPFIGGFAVSLTTVTNPNNIALSVMWIDDKFHTKHGRKVLF